MDTHKKKRPVGKRLTSINYEILRPIFDCIYEAVCVVDEVGVVIVWNASAEKLYAVSHEEIIGHGIDEFFPDAIVDTVRRTGIPVENKCHSPRKDSQILANSRPLFIDDVFKGAVSTDRDYAEVHRLYSELENANSKLVFLENEIRKFSGVFGGIIGKCPNILSKINMAHQIAPTHTSVMITGESGTGKEVFARGIHEQSGRKGLFVPVNCSAIPSELFESEFFGYCPGAFTGASKKGRMGILELSSEGTVFLDEIGDMPLHMQAKLLRVLQEREVVRVGGEKSVKLDLRVVCATNRDLQKMVEEKQFREDLYYRLNVVEIALPPLRDRKEDIPLFINYFIKEFSERNEKAIAGVSKDVLEILNGYEWPGNIRELMNVMEHLVVTDNGGMIQKSSVPEYLLAKARKKLLSREYPLDLTKAIQELEKENIYKALRLTQSNKTKAAKMLNIPRGTLYHKIEEYNINL